MTEPRRRIVRQPPQVPVSDPYQQARLRRLRERLADERASLARWMTRLRRAFNAVLKRQRAVARIEREINKREGS
jgi:hypothetical protein